MLFIMGEWVLGAPQLSKVDLWEQDVFDCIVFPEIEQACAIHLAVPKNCGVC